MEHHGLALVRPELETGVYGLGEEAVREGPAERFPVTGNLDGPACRDSRERHEAVVVVRLPPERGEHSRSDARRLLVVLDHPQLRAGIALLDERRVLTLDELRALDDA